jgi:ribosomal protein S18 acetylase RimI-like enzyme
MAQVTIRSAKPGDARGIAEIHVAAWRVAYLGLIPDEVIQAVSVEQRRGFWKGVLSKPAGWRVDVAEDEDGILAFCSYGPTRDDDVDGAAEIYAIYVHPGKSRRRAGRALCEHALHEASARGHRAMTLWVVKGNEPACRFYERLGFMRDGGERRNTKLLPTPFDEVRYRRVIA